MTKFPSYVAPYRKPWQSQKDGVNLISTIVVQNPASPL